MMEPESPTKLAMGSDRRPRPRGRDRRTPSLTAAVYGKGGVSWQSPQRDILRGTGPVGYVRHVIAARF